MGSYKKIGLSHEMGLIDTPPLPLLISNPIRLPKTWSSLVYNVIRHPKDVDCNNNSVRLLI